MKTNPTTKNINQSALSALVAKSLVAVERLGSVSSLGEASMNYWWVNQNRTWRQEQGGGYMWSPKLKSNGTRNPYYDFMTHVSPGDIVFSFVSRQIVALGVVVSDAYTSLKPQDFGSAGAAWSKDGWRVDVEFQLLARPLEPRNHMSLIRPLMGEKYKPLKTSGDGQELYLTTINHELGKLLLKLAGDPEISMPFTDLSQLGFSAEEQELILDESLRETTKATLVLARRGQGSFRQRVSLFEKECRVTGVAQSQLLIASHIKPWRDSNNEERVSGHNGLFLSPHVDKLFDLGFITFEDNGQLVPSPLLDLEVLDRWSIAKDTKVKRFDQDQAFFLDHHRNNVFEAADV